MKNIKMEEHKIYKVINILDVNILPGDFKKLPDDYFFFWRNFYG